MIHNIINEIGFRKQMYQICNFQAQAGLFIVRDIRDTDS